MFSLKFEKGKHHFAIIALVCAFLQIGLASHMAIFSGIANFALVSTMIAAALMPRRKALWWAFASGLLYDLSTSGFVGLMSLELVVMTYFAAKPLHRAVKDSRRRYLLLSSACIIAVDLVYGAAMLLLHKAYGPGDLLLFQLLPSMGLTWLALLVYTLVAFRGQGHARKKKPIKMWVFPSRPESQTLTYKR